MGPASSALAFLLAVWQTANCQMEAPGQEILIDGFKSDDSISGSYFNTDLKISKASRKSFKAKGTAKIIEDIPSDALIILNFYQQAPSGKLTPMGNEFKKNACLAAEEDKTYFPSFVKGTKFPAKCPFAKGEYEITNSIVEFKDPPNLTPGCYRIQGKIVDSADKTLAGFEIFARATEMDGTSVLRCLD